MKRNILIAEDDWALSDALRRFVESLGYNVTHIVGRVEDGMDVVQSHTVDGALLDVALANTKVWPLAQLLSERGIPFLLMTGDPDADKRELHLNWRCVPKTRLVKTLAAELRSLFADGCLAPKEADRM